MTKFSLLCVLGVWVVSVLATSAVRSQEVFIGNPGKSLNFFHFDLAIERGYFKELGLDVKLIATKCDVAVTALLTGDLQATGCVGIKRLLRGTLRGLQFALKNRGETVRFIAKDYKLPDAVAEKVYTSLVPAMSENGLATERGLKVMVETLGTAVGKNVDFAPERLVDYSLLKEVQKEMGLQ
jgi:ABC-type nitrate/sulfonate/bicarbonate transport system substrate-binding protein